MAPIFWLLSQPLFWAALGVVFGPVLFVRGFSLLQRKRLIMDIPRSSVRAAALGPVELSGTAVGPYTLVAPLSHCDCLYYRIAAKSKVGGNYQKIKMRELSAPLFLDDGTGRVMIYPAQCELQLEASEPSGSRSTGAAGLGSDADEESLQEYCIRPGDSIFVLGSLQENPWANRDPKVEGSELSRIGPGFVSHDEADLLRREAYPALDNSNSLPSGMDDSQGEFDFHPPVIVMKGNGLFVISTNSQREIVEKLGWKSLIYIWGGPAAALWGLWEIFNHAKMAGLLSEGN